jgi:hypothetical protein
VFANLHVGLLGVRCCGRRRAVFHLLLQKVEHFDHFLAVTERLNAVVFELHLRQFEELLAGELRTRKAVAMFG